MLIGYKDLLEKFYDWRNFEARVKGMVAGVQRQPKLKQRGKSWNWKLLLQSLKFVLFSVDKEAQRTILRLIVFTLRRAPFLMRSIGNKVAMQYMQAANMPNRLREADCQIQMEEEMKLQREQTAFFVPDDFKTPYKAIFPELHERIYRGLIDKTRTHEALIEVVYDFLTRWGATFRQFEEYHRTFLYEICDRTIAKENSDLQKQVPRDSEYGNRDVVAEKIPDIRRSRLADEVLHCVEQDLRSFRPPSESREQVEQAEG